MSRLVICKNVELKMSFEWLKQSFFIFRERALHFIILAILSTVIGLLPLFGSFMAPLFIARFALLSKRVEGNQQIFISEIFDGFFANKAVLRLAFLNFVLNTIIFIGQYLLKTQLPKLGVINDTISNSLLLLFLIPVIFLQLGIWLSPIICLEHEDIAPAQAMWLSIKAGLYNVPTLLLYSLLVALFTILAIIPLGLGLLVWLPVLNIACYFVYLSLFK